MGTPTLLHASLVSCHGGRRRSRSKRDAYPRSDRRSNGPELQSPQWPPHIPITVPSAPISRAHSYTAARGQLCRSHSLEPARSHSLPNYLLWSTRAPAPHRLPPALLRGLKPEELRQRGRAFAAVSDQ
ncbi:hypothetical protein AAFF_G00035730 [Aldrovandia affinis]|uniref:Uncharacterized protein n=1 Tax=Aldrovandia affinis TaxID=143900 RepID=A0AAD7S354_9TELE|nr:hypothetical protein AAFF_G00035730 [Aldrovandia affinis]